MCASPAQPYAVGPYAVASPRRGLPARGASGLLPDDVRHAVLHAPATSEKPGISGVAGGRSMPRTLVMT